MTWEEQWSDPRTVAKWLRPSAWVVRSCGSWLSEGRIRALDVGCGPGRHALWLASRGAETFASDSSEAAVRLCADALRRERLPVRVARADMARLPFPGACFDLVVAYNVVYHATRSGLREVLLGLQRLLRPEGVLLVTLKSPEEWVYGRGREIEPDTFLRPGKGVPIHFCREEEIPELVEGFEVLSREYHRRTKAIPGKGERRLGRWLLALRLPRAPAPGRFVPPRGGLRGFDEALRFLDDPTALRERSFELVWKKVRIDERLLEALLRPLRGGGPTVYLRWPERPRHDGIPRTMPDFQGFQVQVFPEDDRLPWLGAALDPERLRARLRSLDRDPGHALETRVLRYKPGKRCVFEVAARGEVPLWIGKVYRPGEGETVFAKMRALSKEFPSPSPLARSVLFDPETSLVLMERVPGEPLAALRAGDRIEALRRAGSLLTRLHALGPLPALPERTLDVEARRAGAAAEKIASAFPEAASRARFLGERIARRLLGLPSQRTACHGEWDPGQILVSGGRAWMLDLDNARNAHPALDVGAFLASLERLGDGREAVGAFLSGYREAGGRIDRRAVSVFRSLKRLRLALTLSRRRESGWEARVARLLGS